MFPREQHTAESRNPDKRLLQVGRMDRRWHLLDGELRRFHKLAFRPLSTAHASSQECQPGTGSR